jgi:hypothetical protein
MIVAVAMPLSSAACGPAKKPQPTVDPVKEQLIILQKQLLELQNNQNETRRLVGEQAARLKSLEEQRTAVPPAPPAAVSGAAQRPDLQTAPAKKPVAKKPPKKKKRPPRRQAP